MNLFYNNDEGCLLMSPTIVLITDFGAGSAYHGIMKGVISRINPEAHVIDLINEIEPGNLIQTEFMLKKNIKYFRDESIFLVVVDPGVGSDRLPVAIKSDEKYFVGPNNGIFSFLENSDFEIWEILPEKLPFIGESNTFHGRDIFAPLAAVLSQFADLNDYCKKINNDKLVRLKFLKFDPSHLTGFVVYVDNFGNAVTNIEKNQFDSKLIDNIEVNRLKTSNFSTTFSDVEPGDSLAYFGSSETLELAINQGNFAKTYDVKPNDVVKLTLKK